MGSRWNMASYHFVRLTGGGTETHPPRSKSHRNPWPDQVCCSHMRTPCPRQPDQTSTKPTNGFRAIYTHRDNWDIRLDSGPRRTERHERASDRSDTNHVELNDKPFPSPRSPWVRIVAHCFNAVEVFDTDGVEPPVPRRRLRSTNRNQW